MGEKMEFNCGTLCSYNGGEAYTLGVVDSCSVEETSNLMDKMYANLTINGQRVRGVVNSIEIVSENVGYLNAVREVRMKVCDFNNASLPEVKKVIYNDPATIIFWTDGTKTVVKCQEGDIYSKEIGFKTAYLKKMLGNDNAFNKEINKWVPKEEPSNRVAKSYTYDEQSDVCIFRDNLGNTILELPRELTSVMRIN